MIHDRIRAKLRQFLDSELLVDYHWMEINKNQVKTKLFAVSLALDLSLTVDVTVCYLRKMKITSTMVFAHCNISFPLLLASSTSIRDLLVLLYFCNTCSWIFIPPFQFTEFLYTPVNFPDVDEKLYHTMSSVCVRHRNS